MEQNNVFQKPFQPQLAAVLLLLLFAMGILAEFSSLIRQRVSISNLLMKTLNALEWVVATIAQQGRLDFCISLRQILHVIFNLPLCQMFRFQSFKK